MREALGMPVACVGASLGFPFWTALLKYDDFTVSYESGLDQIPRFDAHIEVYGNTKSVRVQFDTPYVKGLPVVMTVEEDVNGEYHKREVRKTYEDAYTLEMKELYSFVVDGKPVKTTAEDARKDLEKFQMILKAGTMD
jgi:predicted dehydrogenase